MELYNIIKNIRGLNTEEIIKESINKVKKELNGLTEERTCKIYNGYMLEELNKNHMPARLISTKDLGFNYEHVFILVPNSEEYLLVDLTISQFNITIKELNQLYINGFQKINDNTLKNYLKYVTREELFDNFSVVDVFYSVENKIEESIKFY